MNTFDGGLRKAVKVALGDFPYSCRDVMTNANIIKPSGGDDTNAINNALVSNKKVLFLYDGVFKISSSIILPRGGSLLIGLNGSYYTTIRALRADASDNFTMILNNGRYYNVIDTKCHIQGLTIMANGFDLTTLYSATEYHNMAAGIDIRSANNTIIRDCKTYDTGLRGIAVSTSDRALIENCHAENTGIIPYPNSTDIAWQVKADGNGIDINNSTNGLIQNCTTKNTRDVGVTIWASSNTVIKNCIADGYNGVLTTNGVSNFSIENDSTGCSIQNCAGYNIVGVGIAITSPSSTVTNNTIYNYTGFALGTQADVSNSVITDNVFYNNNFNNSSGVLLGQASDASPSTGILFSRNAIYDVNGSPKHGISCYKLESSEISYNTITMRDTSQDGIGYFGTLGVSTNMLYSNNTISGKCQIGIELSNGKASVISNNTILGTKNSCFALFNSPDCTVDSNSVGIDPATNQAPLNSIRFDTASPSTGCTISNNTFRGFTNGMSYGINDQGGTANPTLINNTSTDGN